MADFRPARAEDIPQIMRVVHEAQAFMRTLGIDQWQDGYPDETTLLRDIGIGQLYVYDDGGAACAVAALSLLPEAAYDAIREGRWRTPKGAKTLTIHRMALDDAHRGGGLARAMLEQARRIAREQGCASVRADTHRGNLAMRRFLEKNGFEYCGLVDYEVKQGDPERVAYEKIL